MATTKTIGKVNGEYTLPTASMSVKGGVKVGASLTIASDGTLNANVPDPVRSDAYLEPTHPALHRGATYGSQDFMVSMFAGSGYEKPTGDVNWKMWVCGVDGTVQYSQLPTKGATVVVGKISEMLNPATGAVPCCFRFVATTATYAAAVTIPVIPANSQLSINANGELVQTIL